MKTKQDRITASDLRRLISLDPETGELSWMLRGPEWFAGGCGRYTPERIAKIWNKRYAGTPALNSAHSMGYRSGKVLYVDMLAHRVVWALSHGEWPTNTIDHINGDKTDNRPSNLRDVMHAENMKNLPYRGGASSGHIGVWHRAKNRKFDAYLTIAGKKKHVGSFSTLDEAVAARASAAANAGYHLNHGRAQE